MTATTPMAKLLGYKDPKELLDDAQIRIVLENSPPALHPIWRSASIHNWLSLIFSRSAPECDVVHNLLGLNVPVPLAGCNGQALIVAIVRLQAAIADDRYRPMNRSDDINIRVFKYVLEEIELPERVKALLGALIVGRQQDYQWLMTVANIEVLRTDPFVFTTPGELDEAHIGWSQEDAANPQKANLSEGLVSNLLDRMKIRQDPPGLDK